ncbi:integrase core domain-containing protein [Microvirga sp. 0TCS3.31]
MLTNNGIQFRLPPRYADGPTARYITHMFDMRCREVGIEHHFTKVNRPRTNGQIKRRNRALKDAIVKPCYYDSHDQLQQHLDTFVFSPQLGRRFKILTGLTSDEYICKIGTAEPKLFRLNPIRQMPGLNA